MDTMIILYYIIGALAVASVTFTISVTSIMEPFRRIVSKIHEKAEELIHCPWCVSFWVLLVLLLTWDIPYVPITNIILLDFFITLFAMYAIVGLVHYVLLRAYAPVAKAEMLRRLEKLQHSNND